MSKVLVIPDLHLPVVKKGFLAHCQKVQRMYQTNKTVFLGDVVDWHGISFWSKQPECPGPSDEYALAKQEVRKWYRAFPKASVCIGNHDERPSRLARSVSIPDFLLRPYGEIWDTKGWTWDYSFIIDDVYYFHGTGYSGVHPAWNAMSKMKMSVVMGHCHARAGIKWSVNPKDKYFAMDAGCGIDYKAFQFAYGKHLTEKPILGCGVVLNGVEPHYHTMELRSK
jgi:predicted phosphodiesterase